MGRKTIKFYIALWGAKLGEKLLKLLGRNASFFPGKFAITICPDFMGILEKPRTVIAVTGTNGKTTVCNMVEDILKENQYDFIDNRYGSNVAAGVATTLLNGVGITGKSKKDLAIIEVDEKSAVKIFPYVIPNYVVCTNLSRDSILRHAHAEYIADILTNNIPKESELILNGDDLIVSNLAPENQKRTYFGIGKLPTDKDKPENLTRDIRVCPKCDTILEYEYVRYHHVGKAYCPNCDFKSPELDYEITDLDMDKHSMTLRVGNIEEKYNLITNNIVNIYNILTAIVILKTIGLSQEQINNALQKQKIVETRYSEEKLDGIRIITQFAKGMNPIACSRAFDYVRTEPGNKVVILTLDDLHEAAKGSEHVAWYYDTDYEFLNDDSIKQVIVGGIRHLDNYVRLQMAGIPANKIVHAKDELEAVNGLNLEGIDTIFILHDLYSMEIRDRIKNKVEAMIRTKEKK